MYAWQCQPQKFGRRQSTAVYDGQSVMMIALIEDDLEPRGPTTGGTRQHPGYSVAVLWSAL